MEVVIFPDSSTGWYAAPFLGDYDNAIWYNDLDSAISSALDDLHSGQIVIYAKPKILEVNQIGVEIRV